MSGAPGASADPSSPMHRVLLLISDLGYGGAERQLVELANRMDRSRFDVHVCALSPHAPLAVDLKERERRLHIIPKHFTFDLTVVFRLAALMRRLKIDLVHGHLFDAAIASRLAGRMTGAVVVGAERNTDYRIKRRQLAAYRLTKGCVDLIIANSRAGAAYNGRMLGHDAAMYRVLYNGVNTDRFQPRDSTAARRELGIDGPEPVVGMFASFKRQKNHPLFLKAARRVLAQAPTARFLLVGDVVHDDLEASQAQWEQAQRLVDELGLRERCLFLGNRNDVERLYGACQVVVLPSLHEGTPNVLLEAMACGVPVVATDVSDNAVLVEDGRTGYVVPSGDEAALADRIGALLSQEPRRIEMGRLARERVVERYSIDTLARSTERIYTELLQARSGAKDAR